jgi:hypothetical protein
MEGIIFAFVPAVGVVHIPTPGPVTVVEVDDALADRLSEVYRKHDHGSPRI